MKKKVFILLILILLMQCIKGSIKSPSHERSVDFVSDIVSTSKCKIVECGVRTLYKTTKSSEDECLSVKNKLLINGEFDISIFKNEGIYCVEFSNDKIDGYIESMTSKDGNSMVINYNKKTASNDVKSIEKNLAYAVNKKASELTFYDYVKGSSSNNNKSSLNKKIIKKLEEKGATNIKTLDIDNGITTTAYTGMYPIYSSEGQYVDINYSLCSYDSGNYIVVGTPVLVSTY